MKTIALAVLLATLSGCIVVPLGHGGYRDGYRDRGDYYRR